MMFWAATFHHHPFLVPLFQLFTTNSDIKKDKTTWFAGQLPHCHATVQLCLAPTEADCPYALQNQTLPQALNVFHAAKSVHILLQIKIPSFLSCLRLSYSFITHIFKFLDPNRPSTLKIDSDVCDSFVSPS